VPHSSKSKPFVQSAYSQLSKTFSFAPSHIEAAVTTTTFTPVAQRTAHPLMPGAVQVLSATAPAASLMHSTTLTSFAEHHRPRVVTRKESAGAGAGAAESGISLPHSATSLGLSFLESDKQQSAANGSAASAAAATSSGTNSRPDSGGSNGMSSPPSRHTLTSSTKLKRTSGGVPSATASASASAIAERPNSPPPAVLVSAPPLTLSAMPFVGRAITRITRQNSMRGSARATLERDAMLSSSVHDKLQITIS
jgi:hypothetical protein